MKDERSRMIKEGSDNKISLTKRGFDKIENYHEVGTGPFSTLLDCQDNQ